MSLLADEPLPKRVIPERPKADRQISPIVRMLVRLSALTISSST